MQPWLAPDARPPDAVPPPAPVTAVDESRPLVPSPVAMRPMTVADVLDGGIAVIKAAPRLLIGIAAAILVPVELVSAWVQRDSLADRGLSGAISAATSTNGSSDVRVDAGTIGLLVLSGLALALVTGAVAAVLRGWLGETTPTAGDALRAALHHAPALIVAWIIVHVVELAAAVALLLPLLFVMPMFLTTSPAIVFERLGPWAGVRRSWLLARTRYGASLGAAVLIAAVSSSLTLALSGLGLVFEVLSFGWIIDAVCRAASGLITVPFVAAATTLVYLDIRIRVEGLDLELDFAERFTHGG